MNFFISLIIFINIHLSFSASEDEKKEKEIAQAERKVKTLACTILSNTNIPFYKNTRREIKELLKKNDIIQRTAELKVKVPEFLAAICFTKIEINTAQEIVESLSKRKMEVLEKKEYEDLFAINPDLNFTRIKRVMNRVSKIMKKIEKEELKKEEEDNNKTFELDEDNIDVNGTNYFNFNNMILKFKNFLNNLDAKHLYGIGINLIFIIATTIVIFCVNNKSDESNNNETENKTKEKKEKVNGDNEGKEKEKEKENNNKKEDENDKNNLLNKDKQVNNKDRNKEKKD